MKKNGFLTFKKPWLNILKHSRYHKAARAQAPNSQALIELAKVINLDDNDNEDETSETLLISGKIT